MMIKRPPKSDGFKEMIEADHKGAKENPVDVVAEMVAQFDGVNAKEIATEIIRWLNEGDVIE